MVLSLMMKKKLLLRNTIPRLRSKWPKKMILYFWLKTIAFGAADTYVADIVVIISQVQPAESWCVSR